MPTSILYHAWGIVDYDYVGTKFVDGRMILDIKAKSKRLRCPACRSQDAICPGSSHRWFRTLPVGGRPVFLDLTVQRLDFRRCHAIRQVDLGFADPRVSYAKRFERTPSSSFGLPQFMMWHAISWFRGMSSKVSKKSIWRNVFRK